MTKTSKVVQQPMTRKEKFRIWLLKHQWENTVIGDLARDVAIDPYTNKLSNERSAWLHHIAPKTVIELEDESSGVCGTLHELFDLYESNISAPKPMRKRNRKRADDHWTISCPEIPNYGMFHGDCLLRVHPTSKDAAATYEAMMTSGVWLNYTNVVGETYAGAVQTLAKYFKREFGYDWLSYTVDDHFHTRYDDPKCKVDAYIFCTGDPGFSIAAGATSFFWEESMQRWVMNFVYLFPTLRRRGVLSKHWGTFQAQYGDFLAIRPLSDAMESFLRNRDELERHG